MDDHLVFGGGDESARHRFLKTILQQLSERVPEEASRSMTIDDLRAIIQTACLPYASTYIIVDGLDRCPAASRDELEDEITNLLNHGCHVMITN